MGLFQYSNWKSSPFDSHNGHLEKTELAFSSLTPLLSKNLKKMTILSFPLFESFDTFQLEFQELEKRAENISL